MMRAFFGSVQVSGNSSIATPLDGSFTTRKSRRQLFGMLCIISATAIAGCNRGDSAKQPTAQGSTSGASQSADGLQVASSGLTAASISAADNESNSAEPSPVPDSPEWLLDEIKSMMGQRLPDTEPQEVAVIRRERSQKAIELATEAIVKSHADPAQEKVFNEAVRLLMEARLSLAMDGDKARVEELYQDAASLCQRAPKSKSAAEASFVLARFAQLNCQLHANEEPHWLGEYARQSRSFAENFPDETERAVSLLYSAGWTCELNRRTDEATACYSLLKDRYPDSPQAQQVTAVMRRLALKGQPLELAGPTFDGKYVQIDDFRGKVVLVVFWASDAKGFVELLPQISSATQAHGGDDFKILGVNLDEEKEAVGAFIKEHSLAWPQVFHVDEKDRRWNHPTARFYGIREIPLLWLVDRNGIVVDTAVDPARLDAQVAQLLGPKPAKKPGPIITPAPRNTQAPPQP